ncbi:stress-responsive transcription factor hsf1, partial [Coelomomyces lativittatus]
MHGGGLLTSSSSTSSSSSSTSSTQDDGKWEFMNEHFLRGQPDLLCLIHRKKPTSEDKMDPDYVHLVFNEVSAVRKHQLALSSEQKELHSHLHLLYQELIATKSIMHQQQETIDKIMGFLMSLYTNAASSASSSS